MRKLSKIALIAFSFSVPAHAQQIVAGPNQIVFHASDLPYDAREATCDDIIAQANHNKYTMLMAGGLYANGMHMGDRCVKIDYFKAFEYYKKGGFTQQIESSLKYLKARADKGHNRSRYWVRKLKKAGYQFER